MILLPLANVRMVLLAAVLGLLTLPLAAQQVAITKATGRVEFSAPNSSSRSPLSAPSRLAVLSTIYTGADGSAIVVPVPGVAINVAPNSTLVLTEATFADARSKRAALVNLRRGTVSAYIDPNVEPRADFRVQTTDGVAAARGTFFAVSVVGGKTIVAVEHGKVGVARLGGSVSKRA